MPNPTDNDAIPPAVLLALAERLDVLVNVMPSRFTEGEVQSIATTLRALAAPQAPALDQEALQHLHIANAAYEAAEDVTTMYVASHGLAMAARRYLQALRAAPRAPAAPQDQRGVHGETCAKAPHSNSSGGYLHAADDDTPYDVDGVRYCGRCHYAL